MPIIRNKIVLFLLLFASVIFGITASVYDSFQRLKVTANLHIHNTIEDPCASFDCQNDGSCLLIEEKPRCLCQEGYEGSHCETKIEEISTVTQQIEITSDNSGDKDPCASFDCQNDGYCMLMGEKPICLCKEGYQGSHCEKISETDETSTVTPHTETTSEDSRDKVTDPCVSMPCQNEGICIQNGSTFNCYCKPPYSGAFCEKDPCAENPCQNGGSCVNTQYSFKCHCRYPYSGDICQYDACSDNPCLNGGSCVKDGQSFQCRCRYGYKGKICESEGFESTTDFTTEAEDTSVSSKFTLNFNLTTINPGICVRNSDCLNGGICTNSYCECPPNFGGSRCEKNVLCEKLQPTCSAMGATCKIIGLNAICDCPQDKMYHPKSVMCEGNVENMKDICDPLKCHHGRCEIDGRTYKCICVIGYKGQQCDEIEENKVEKSYVLFAVMISLMVLICLLLISQMWLFCQNQKFSLLTSDSRQCLEECSSSRPTISEA